jgi:hypothetical protein
MSYPATFDDFEENLGNERRSEKGKNKEKNKYNPKKINVAGTIQKTGIEVIKSPVWIAAFAAGIACDLADAAMIAAWPITFFIRPFLLIFLLFHGSWGRKMGRSFLLLLDFIPVIGFIPFSTCCVIDAYWKSLNKKK